MKIIEVKNLSFAYTGEKQTLIDVSFYIEKGKYVSIVGHNGSGKSTLAKLLIGLLKKSDGQIIVDGIELNEKSVNQIRNKISLVFQNPDNQFIGATVEDDIAFGLENKRIKHEDMQAIIDDYAKKVNMFEYLHKEPSMLSGGQKQRVAIAGALALSPEILIFDESTSMLDPKGKREIRELIIQLRKNNPDLTVISITHDIEEAYLSDEIIVLSKGKFVMQGNPKEILSNKEKLSSLDLHMPFMLEMKEKLSSMNIDASKCEDINQLVEVLCQSK